MSDHVILTDFEVQLKAKLASLNMDEYLYDASTLPAYTKPTLNTADLSEEQAALRSIISALNKITPDNAPVIQDKISSSIELISNPGPHIVGICAETLWRQNVCNPAVLACVYQVFRAFDKTSFDTCAHLCDYYEKSPRRFMREYDVDLDDANEITVLHKQHNLLLETHVNLAMTLWPKRSNTTSPSADRFRNLLDTAMADILDQIDTDLDTAPLAVEIILRALGSILMKTPATKMKRAVQLLFPRCIEQIRQMPMVYSVTRYNIWLSPIL